MRDTSLEAYESLQEHLNTLQQKVYAFVEQQKGATCEEIELAFPMKHSTASGRLWELHKMGLIHDGGQRRKTTSGRRAIVWELV